MIPSSSSVTRRAQCERAEDDDQQKEVEQRAVDRPVFQTATAVSAIIAQVSMVNFQRAGSEAGWRSGTDDERREQGAGEQDVQRALHRLVRERHVDQRSGPAAATRSGEGPVEPVELDLQGVLGLFSS
jgi:hypothetical protein